MSHNSITGGHVNFILGSQREDDPANELGAKWLP